MSVVAMTAHNHPTANQPVKDLDEVGEIPPLGLGGTCGRRSFLTRQLRHSRPFRELPEETFYRYFVSFFRDAIISRLRSISRASAMTTSAAFSAAM